MGLARTLSRLPRAGPPLCARCDGLALPRLATGSATKAFPVPGGVARDKAPKNLLRPIVGGFPYGGKVAGLAVIFFFFT